MLSKADYIVVMKEGKISEQGTYQQLIDNEGHFSNFLLEYLIEETKKDETKENIEENDDLFTSNELNNTSNINSTEQQPCIQRNGSIRSKSSVRR